MGQKQSQQEKDQALIKAVTNGKIEEVRTLLKNGANPSFEIDGRSSLHWACYQRVNQDVLIELLLRSGADKDKYDSFGRTPLMIACITSNVCALRVLIKSGADLNARENRPESKRTALFIAMDFDKQQDCVCELMNAVADQKDELNNCFISASEHGLVGSQSTLCAHPIE